MYRRSTLAAVLASVVGSTALAQQGTAYRVPRTEHGHPDFQGVWATAFLTTLERPPGVNGLVATPEQAQALVAAVRDKMPSVIDPDVQLHDIRQLAIVKGQYRTSIIVEPEDGRMPFTKAGLDLAASVSSRNGGAFDDPEQRPGAERCLENLGHAPIRAVPVFLPRQIVQTRDHVLVVSEDADGLRVIRLNAAAPSAWMRSVGGYSVGYWEGDTLVVRTTNIRTDDPARNVMGRPLLLSPQTRITERFTRVSDSELLYRFTVEDAELYTQPWTGEFSLTRHDIQTFEYGCHEGNYSLPNALRGGQAEAARKAAGVQ